MSWQLPGGKAAFILVFTTLLLIATDLNAQPIAYNHPELEWHQTETEHFVIRFHQGEEWLATVAAEVARDIYGPITSFYGYEPDTKIHIILYDTDDYSNGGAWYYNNKIYIWATSLDIPLRGSHNWLRNVLTHEFTHMIQLGASRKAPRWLQAVYLQLIDYERETREDVLYGFPNHIGAYPLPFTLVPMWFAEGTAQFQMPELGYDSWDTERDMLLRMKVLNDDLLDFWDMETFGHTSINNEAVYNQGFAFVHYLVDRFGLEVLSEITDELQRPFTVSMNRTMKRVTGSTGLELWQDWHDQLNLDYNSDLAVIKDHLQEGELLTTVGDGNRYPVTAPGDSLLYFLSNRTADYLGLTSLYHIAPPDSELHMDVVGARGKYALLPDGSGWVFSRTSPVTKWGHHLRDLYLQYQDGKPLQLTKHQRLSQPAVSPDGKRIAAIQNESGSNRLVLLDIPDVDADSVAELSKRERKASTETELQILVDVEDGRQYYSPAWLNDSTIIVATSYLQGRDIIAVDVKSGEITRHLSDLYDERDPWPAADGSGFYFASDRTGIYNIYYYDLPTGSSTALTNVLGAAIQPTVDSNGTLYFTSYTGDGFQIARLQDPQAVDTSYMTYRDTTDEYWYPEVTFDDTQLATIDVDPPELTFESNFIVPRIAWDGGNFKPGGFIFTNDIMGDIDFLLAFGVHTREDYDLYGNAGFNLGRYHWYIESFFIGRFLDQEFDDPTVIVGEDEAGNPVYDKFKIHYRFNMMEVAPGISRRFNDRLVGNVGFSFNRYSNLMDFGDGAVFRYTYLKGSQLKASFDWERRRRDISIDGDISPRYGERLFVQVQGNHHRFIDDFAVAANGVLDELYTTYDFLDLHFSYHHYFPLPKTKNCGWGIHARGDFLDRDNVDDFFHVYLGGLEGMRGYSYYSMGGTRNAMLKMDVTFPLWRHIHHKFWHLYPKQLYMELFGAAGSAWTGGFKSDEIRREAGGELRLAMSSWGFMPTAITWGAAWGFDEFQNNTTQGKVDYGHEWRYYLKILFNFEEIQRASDSHHQRNLPYRR